MLNLISEQFNLSGDNPNSYSPLTLAFVGDCVFEVIVKTYVVLSGNCPANELDKKSVRFIKATSQAKIADYLLDGGMLSEEEQNIFRRGRNAKSASTAKNASVGDYRKATGLEALIGYLYLQGKEKRCIELIQMGEKALEEEK